VVVLWWWRGAHTVRLLALACDDADASANLLCGSLALLLDCDVSKCMFYSYHGGRQARVVNHLPAAFTPSPWARESGVVVCGAHHAFGTARGRCVAGVCVILD